MELSGCYCNKDWQKAMAAAILLTSVPLTTVPAASSCPLCPSYMPCTVLFFLSGHMYFSYTLYNIYVYKSLSLSVSLSSMFRSCSSVIAKNLYLTPIGADLMSWQPGA